MEVDPQTPVPVTSVTSSELPQLALGDHNQRGTLGRKFKVTVNHIPLRVTPTRTIFYRYRLDVTDERSGIVRDMLLCRSLVKGWSKHENSPLRGRPYVYDASHLMFFNQPLEKEVYEDQIVIRDDGPYSSGGRRTLNVVLKSAGKVNTTCLLSPDINRKGFHPEDVMSALQFCNVALSHFPSQSHFTVGSSMFSMEDSNMIIGLGNVGINLHIGSYTSCRLLRSGLSLNIDVSNTLMYPPGSVLSIVCSITGQRMDSSLSIPPRKRNDVMQYLQGLKINYAFPKGQKRSCRVYGLSERSISEIEFELEGGEITTVKKYFENKYGCEFLYHNLQCFNSSNKPGRDSWMPIEFSTIVQRQLYRKAIDNEVASEIIRHTCQSPSLRLEKIQSAYERIKSPKRLYDEFSITPKGEFMRVEARKLPEERLKFGNSSKVPTITPVNGAWNLKDKVFINSSSLKNWQVVSCCNAKALDDIAINKFMGTLQRSLENLGVKVLKSAIIHRMPDASRNATAVKLGFTKLFSAEKGVDMVVVCLPRENETEVYRSVKLVADTELGIPTQCVALKNVLKSSPYTCNNIALKMNLKLGGVNYSLDTKVERVSSCPTMVIGADVSHPDRTGGTVKSLSVASVVGSINSSCTSYVVSTKPQIPNTESFSLLQEQIADLMTAFYKKNKTLPSSIIYFRDGVSEGDISYATRSEVNSIILAAKVVKSTWRPKITYISCNKRHHTRMFPLQEDLSRAGANRPRSSFSPQEFPYQNVPPGTVIDGDITNVGFRNFYIVPHAGLKGTSRPIHYQILHDENQMTMDQLQKLVYQLSHLYGRSTTIVSHVTPVYYAHVASRRASAWYSAMAKLSPKLASLIERMDEPGFRGTDSIKLHPNLANNLWFL